MNVQPYSAIIRQGSRQLEKLLMDAEIMSHPFIVCELGCGNLKNRTEIISLLQSLPKALSIFDPDHSETEDRWITMGISEKGRLLVVIHTFREGSEGAVTIRIISSRKATKQETKSYGE